MKAKDKVYTNYRLKTRTLPVFNDYHTQFYTLDEKTNKYIKIVPDIIQDIICPVIQAHFIIGDRSFGSDGRVRIFTNRYTYDECVLLVKAIHKNCGIQCAVLFDRINKNGEKQYILTIGKTQQETENSSWTIYT